MTPEDLIDCYPELYHVTASGAWCSIRKRGLLTTNDLLSSDGAEFSYPLNGPYGALDNPSDWKGKKEHEDPESGCGARDSCVRVCSPEACLSAVIRDQVPLHGGGVLEKQLSHQRHLCSSTPTLKGWYKRQNGRVFFFPTIHGAKILAEKYLRKGAPQIMLVVCTRSLIDACGDRIELAAYNSGNTEHQGENVVSVNGLEKWHYKLFLPLEEYDYNYWHRKRRKRRKKHEREPVKEVTVKGGVRDIAKHVIKVVEMDGSEEESELAECCRRPSPQKPSTCNPTGGRMHGV